MLTRVRVEKGLPVLLGLLERHVDAVLGLGVFRQASGALTEQQTEIHGLCKLPLCLGDGIEWDAGKRCGGLSV
jgi:hypothetical protein